MQPLEDKKMQDTTIPALLVSQTIPVPLSSNAPLSRAAASGPQRSSWLLPKLLLLVLLVWLVARYW